MGRHGPVKKPGFIHCFAEKKRLKNTSITQPENEPSINRNASIEKTICAVSSPLYPSNTVDPFECSVFLVELHKVVFKRFLSVCEFGHRIL